MLTDSTSLASKDHFVTKSEHSSRNWIEVFHRSRVSLCVSNYCRLNGRGPTELAIDAGPLTELSLSRCGNYRTSTVPWSATGRWWLNVPANTDPFVVARR